jgi:mycothiol S-conjugate amidase
LAGAGQRSFWMPPEDATPEQIAEHQAFLERALVPDERITTRVDVAPYLEHKWQALVRHVTQISPSSPFMALGLNGWRDSWSTESYVLRDTRIDTDLPETDLFAGLEGGPSPSGPAPSR